MLQCHSHHRRQTHRRARGSSLRSHPDPRRTHPRRARSKRCDATPTTAAKRTDGRGITHTPWPDCQETPICRVGWWRRGPVPNQRAWRRRWATGEEPPHTLLHSRATVESECGSSAEVECNHLCRGCKEGSQPTYRTGWRRRGTCLVEEGGISSGLTGEESPLTLLHSRGTVGLECGSSAEVECNHTTQQKAR